MRFVAILGLIVSVISSAAWADTTLQCTETLYDKTGNNPYDIPHYFILQDGDIFRKAILVWDNEKVDLTVVTNTPATIEATGKAKAHMPRPVEIDQCVKDELANRPDLREANGTVNLFLVLHCETRAGMSDTEIPIDVSVTINHVTGQLEIERRQDNNSQHNTHQIGSCKATPKF
jgi:hypothetical protein